MADLGNNALASLSFYCLLIVPVSPVPTFLTPTFRTRNTDQTLLHSRHLPLSGDGEEQGSALSKPFPPAITNKKVRFLTKFNYQLTD
ncbi:hypothetical protein RY972_08790 [Aeromonas allosaccharophila]|uniref:Uncharacterized protein n=1 Tax=Aeromonas allosaccharophila TaxID=656 RepID=A0ABZ0FEX4_9GAMM|nr:hypothetical protein [Aeromonas allosaccharophila]WOE68129.1 hypothetical protein RY972_08790 [Aeromonas allosaccharophila]